MKKLFFILMLCPLFVQLHGQEAQKPEQLVIIILIDKSELNGQLIEENDQQLVIRTKVMGLMTISRTEIKKVIYLNAKGRLPNPTPYRYFLGQSAYNLEKGEGFYQNVLGTFNLVGYGISDRLSGLVGVELITLSLGEPLITANLKYGFPVAKNLNMGLSGSLFTFSDEFTLGSVTGMATYGSKESNISVGVGYGIANGTVSDGALINIAGQLRIAKKLSLLTENYILSGASGGVNSFGVRFIGKKITTAKNLL